MASKTCENPRPTITRSHGRIWFDKNVPGENWSTEDIGYPRLHEEFDKINELKLYYARGLISTFVYLLVDCPTTALAQQKLACMRRALRDVPNPYEESPDAPK